MKFRMLLLIFASLVFCGTCTGEEVSLRNIRQVTFASMGFEKAGEAYFSPDGRSIIFQAVPTGEKQYQIYTMDLESQTPLRVSTGKGACTCGFYRPDGKKILFASSHEALEVVEPEKSPGKYTWDLTPYMNIYEADLDGSSLKALTRGPAYHAECAYSPDEKQIVYASNESGSMNLYICDADGANVRHLTQTRECYNGGPFFSPKGDWVVFRADRQEKDKLQLYLIRPDGSEERQLTSDSYVNWAPFWHPNGKIIAYTTSKHGHHAYQIYLIDIDTLRQYRLTYTSTFEGLPSFSSDGKRIAWTSKRGGGAPQVFVADFSLPPELD
ncbi:MAG: PD40 domain-containing protein [Chlamydiales bacterium]|nr:PD40 domain-containing protein [Chlamydiales bacterium]